MKNKKQILKSIIVLCSFVFGFFSPAVGFAAVTGGMNNGAINVAPHLEDGAALIRSWITYKAPAGAKIEDAVDIENTTNDVMTVDLMTADAKNPDKEHFELQQPSAPKNNIGKWIELKSPSKITLKPNEVKSIPIVITVPKDTAAAEYWGAVLVEETNDSQSDRTETAAEKNQTRMLVKTRLGIRTMVQVSAEKDAKVERLLIATKPNVPETVNPGLTLWAKIYLAFLLTYTLMLLGWIIFEKINKHQKILKTLGRLRAALIGLLVLAGGLFLILPNSLVQNLSTSVLGDPEHGLSIAPAPKVDEKGDIVDRPSWFITNGDPNGTITSSMVVTNDSDSATDVVVTAVDAAITDQGGFALEATDHEQFEIGKWITIDEPKFHLDPRSQKVVNFAMHLPADLAPGDHAGGIVAEVDRSVKKSDGLTSTGMTVATRVGVRIYLTASGELKFGSEFSDFKLTQDDDDMWHFAFVMKNTGNVRFKSTVDFELHDSADQIIKNYSDNANEIMPGKTAKVNMKLPWKRLDEGKYKLIAKINDSQKVSEQKLDLIVDSSRPVREKAVDKNEVAHEAAPAAVISPVILYAIIGFGVLMLILIIILIVVLLKKKTPAVVATVVPAKDVNQPTIQPPQNPPAGV